MKARLVKEGGVLAPFDTETEEWLERKPDGKYFECEIKTPRNYKFHKKLFALLNIAYPYWAPPEFDTELGKVTADKGTFREKVLIQAGHWKYTIDYKNRLQIVADSISYDRLPTDDLFEKVYNDVVDVIILKVLVGWTIEQVNDEVGTFL